MALPELAVFCDNCGYQVSPLAAAGPQWAGRRSNPSLLVFSQALNHLSYQPGKRRSPVSFV